MHKIIAAIAGKIAGNSYSAYAVPILQISCKGIALIPMSTDCNDVRALLRKELTGRSPEPLRASDHERIFSL